MSNASLKQDTGAFLQVVLLENRYIIMAVNINISAFLVEYDFK